MHLKLSEQYIQTGKKMCYHDYVHEKRVKGVDLLEEYDTFYSKIDGVKQGKCTSSKIMINF